MTPLEIRVRDLWGDDAVPIPFPLCLAEYLFEGLGIGDWGLGLRNCRMGSVVSGVGFGFGVWGLWFRV